MSSPLGCLTGASHVIRPKLNSSPHPSASPPAAHHLSKRQSPVLVAQNKMLKSSSNSLLLILSTSNPSTNHYLFLKYTQNLTTPHTISPPPPSWFKPPPTLARIIVKACKVSSCFYVWQTATRVTGCQQDHSMTPLKTSQQLPSSKKKKIIYTHSHIYLGTFVPSYFAVIFFIALNHKYIIYLHCSLWAVSSLEYKVHKSSNVS